MRAKGNPGKRQERGAGRREAKLSANSKTFLSDVIQRLASGVLIKAPMSGRWKKPCFLTRIFRIILGTH